jgi:PhnB protein
MIKRILPHIYLENCKEAIEFYQQVLGGEIKNTQLADGMEMFKGHEGKYIHAELHINESSVIYFADVFEPQTKGTNIWLSLDLETEMDIQDIYQKLSEGGEIKKELQDTFWGAKYAIIKDRFGLTWEMNSPK